MLRSADYFPPKLQCENLPGGRGGGSQGWEDSVPQPGTQALRLQTGSVTLRSTNMHKILLLTSEPVLYHQLPSKYYTRGKNQNQNGRHLAFQANQKPQKQNALQIKKHVLTLLLRHH